MCGGGTSRLIQRMQQLQGVALCDACRDVDGHGSHCAGTAGGNQGVLVVGPLAPPGALLSGVAPRARLAVYKVRWLLAG